MNPCSPLRRSRPPEESERHEGSSTAHSVHSRGGVLSVPSEESGRGAPGYRDAEEPPARPGNQLTQPARRGGAAQGESPQQRNRSAAGLASSQKGRRRREEELTGGAVSTSPLSAAQLKPCPRSTQLTPQQRSGVTGKRSGVGGGTRTLIEESAPTWLTCSFIVPAPHQQRSRPPDLYRRRSRAEKSRSRGTAAPRRSQSRGATASPCSTARRGAEQRSVSVPHPARRSLSRTTAAHPREGASYQEQPCSSHTAEEENHTSQQLVFPRRSITLQRRGIQLTQLSFTCQQHHSPRRRSEHRHRGESSRSRNHTHPGSPVVS